MKKPILPDSLAIFLLVFPFLKPHSLEYLLPIADNLFDAGRLACALVIVWLCIKGPYRMSTFAKVFLALQLWIAAVTALRNPARLPASLINGAALGALTLIVDYYAQKNPRQLIRSLLANFEWLLYLNLLSVLLYPKGLYRADGVHRYYFLGLSNSFMIYVIPAFMAALMNLFSGMNRIRSLTVMAAGAAAILIRRPATGLVGVGVTLLVLLLAVRDKDRPWLPAGIWLTSLAVDLGVTVFQVTDRIKPLKRFIVNVLHRNPSYTGRTEIWNKAMEIIAREPWIGQGFETKVPVAPDNLFSHAHNAYLQYWYIAGIAGLLLFLLLIVLVIRAVRLAPAGRYKYAVIAPLAGLFFAFIPEACNYPALMMLLPLAANTAAFAGLHRARKAKPLPPSPEGDLTGKPMKKNVFKNIIMLYGYSIAKILIPFATVPYLTRVMSTDCYGVVLYVKNIGTYLQLIVDFGFMLSGTKDIVMVRENREEVGEVSGDILLARLLLAALAFAGLCVCTRILPILRGYELYTMLSFLPIFCTIFLFDYIFRGLEQMQVITSRFLIMRGLAAVLTYVFVHGDGDMMWIQILDILGGLAAVLLVLLELRKLGIRIRIRSLGRAWKKLQESALYFLSNMATTAFNVLNTLLVGIFQAPSDVAYWSVCLSMVSAIQSFYSPITDGVYPDMVKTKNINQIKQMMKVFMPLVAAGCVFCYLVADYALLVLGGGKYVGAAYLFRAMIPILFFSFPAMLFGWPTIGALGKTVQITFTTVFSACFQIAGLLALGLSGHFTLLNLAILRCTTELVLLLTRLAFTWRYRGEFVRAEVPPLKLRKRHERTDG